MVKIGNAPVSYGAFEVTVGKCEGVPTATEVLDAVQAAGYDGIDLGPLGYLGLRDELRAALSSRGLLLTGGYVEIDVSSDEAPEPGMAELARVCDQFDVVAGGTGSGSQFLPRPTVALIGSAANSGEEALSERWNRIERVIGDVVKLCGGRGYQAVLHNEVGTQISSEDSVIRVLETTQAALCLDTGHLVAAGGDPLAILDGWRERVTHVHLKDAKPADAPFSDAMQLWDGDVFCRLGAGRGRVEGVLDSLRTGGYEGWIVVEQDVLPRSPRAYQQASADQQQNRRFLRDRGW